jgi:hypothetical protein
MSGTAIWKEAALRVTAAVMESIGVDSAALKGFKKCRILPHCNFGHGQQESRSIVLSAVKVGRRTELPIEPTQTWTARNSPEPLGLNRQIPVDSESMSHQQRPSAFTKAHRKNALWQVNGSLAYDHPCSRVTDRAKEIGVSDQVNGDRLGATEAQRRNGGVLKRINLICELTIAAGRNKNCHTENQHNHPENARLIEQT